MFLPLHPQTDYKPGPDLTIDCPHCGARGASAYSYDEVETLRVLYILPVAWKSRTFVNCRTCEVQLRSKVPARELPNWVGPRLMQVLIYDPSEGAAAKKLLVIIALFLSVLPIVGSLLAAFALWTNRKSPGWPRVVSALALALSIVAYVLIRFFPDWAMTQLSRLAF